MSLRHQGVSRINKTFQGSISQASDASNAAGLRSAMSIRKMSNHRISILRSLLTAFICCLAAPALAETIDVYDNHGGSVVQYNARWAGLAARGVDVRIVGPCQSACTILLGHIPRSPVRVPSRAPAGCHADALECLSGRYPRMDRRPWWPEKGFCLDGCSRHLSIFQKVLKRDRVASITQRALPNEHSQQAWP